VTLTKRQAVQTNKFTSLSLSEASYYLKAFDLIMQHL